MKKLPIYLFVALIVATVSSCSLDDKRENDTDVDITAWAAANADWYLAQKAMKNADGTPFYTVVVPAWSPSSEVLMHWYNDRSLTAGNLTPLETSTVDCKYILRLYDGTPVDSSFNKRASYGDSIFRTKVTDVIDGWQIALQNMKVGDSVRIVMAYPEGYGTSSSGDILPYSSLEFDVKLVDIPFYEIR